ncbi:MAG: N-acetylmuramoyl-L-alanine amidase, partial [Thermoanaerobaculia bacterium]
MLFAAPIFPSESSLITARITSELRASLTHDYEIEVAVQPHPGDAWSRLAKRVTGDGEHWKDIAAFNDSGDKLTTHKSVRVPLAMLRPDLQRQVLTTLFSTDALKDAGWRHTVVGGSGVEGESLWKIAEWFTGDGANYMAIRKANPAQSLSTRKGDVIVIPKGLLTAAFGGGSEGKNGSTTSAEVRQSTDDPVEHAAADEESPQAAVEAVAMGAPSLTYERNAPEPYAIYPLQKGQALYSSVAIRFTGRVYSSDVGDVVDRIVQFNGISDVSRIRVGYPVKIPMSLLLPEYRPSDDPQFVAREKSLRASEKLAKRTHAKNLTGVHVILDAGHGGRDGGTTHDGVSEARYVYDITCRLKRLLEKRSAATVSVTTKSESNGYDVSDDDELDSDADEVVLTTPRYPLDDSTVGVNLRWYLANSIFRHAIRKQTSSQKVVFLSIHADSLHPSLRGAMAYIPGGRFVQGRYQKSEGVYLARAEVREHPVVRHTEKESLTAEGLSRDLAESIIDSFDDAGLHVHPFNPVRDNVIRDGREWVPAIIRYNLVPTRLLLEVCNLGNQRDRELMKSRKFRQQVAETIYRGIVRFYGRGTAEEK